MRNARIPVKHYLFVQYVIKNNEYLHEIPSGGTLTRGEILGLVTDELNSLKAFSKALISNDPLLPGIWDKHSNPDTKNRVTRLQLLELKKQFKTFFSPLLNRMSGSSNITVADRLVLNIAQPDSTRTRPTIPIAEKCFANIKILGGGDVKFECRYNSDGSRSGKPEGADGVEVAYDINPPEAADGGNSSETVSKVRRYDLVDPEAASHRFISTRAIFTLSLGAGKAGYTLQFFTRFVNSKYPKLAGSWSALGVITIS